MEKLEDNAKTIEISSSLRLNSQKNYEIFRIAGVPHSKMFLNLVVYLLKNCDKTVTTDDILEAVKDYKRGTLKSHVRILEKVGVKTSFVFVGRRKVKTIVLDKDSCSVLSDLFNYMVKELGIPPGGS